MLTHSRSRTEGEDTAGAVCNVQHQAGCENTARGVDTPGTEYEEDTRMQPKQNARIQQEQNVRIQRPQVVKYNKRKERGCTKRRMFTNL